MIDVYYFDKRLKKSDPSKLKMLQQQKKRVWVDLTDPNHHDISQIKDIFSIHPITSEDLLTHNTRAKIEEFDDYIFVILYGIYKQKNIRMRELNFILGKNFLITSHKKKIDYFEKLKSDDKKLESLLKCSLDFLMHNLIDAEVDNFIPVLELFDNVIDSLEDNIIQNPDQKTMEKILDLKRRINKIKKIVVPQQEKISMLAKNKYNLITPDCQTYFRDVHDHFYTVTDMIEDHKDTLSGIFDAYMSSVSNSTNEVMKVLSVMATIMLPLTVISGVYGMNFAILPGSKDPMGFWMIIGLMVAMIVLMLGYFKKKNWL